MVSINKNEKEKILKVYPKAHIHRTMIQDSKRHHYNLAEDPELLHLLREIRGEQVVEEGVARGGHDLSL